MKRFYVDFYAIVVCENSTVITVCSQVRDIDHGMCSAFSVIQC